MELRFPAQLRRALTAVLLLLVAVSQAAPPVGTAVDANFFRPQPETPGPASRRSGVVISEVMYHPAKRTDGRNLQFIEIFNSLPWFQDMAGWKITGDISYTFPTNFVLNPLSYAVIAAAPDDLVAVTGQTNVFGPFSGSLSGGSGKLGLLHRNGGVFFELNYDSQPPWPVSPDGAGHSLVLARPSYGEGDVRAWDASAYVGGSPGLPEPAVTNDLRTVVINEVLAKRADGAPGFLELFNYANAPADLSGCVLTDDPTLARYVFPTNSLVGALGFVSLTETELGFGLRTAGETVYLIAADGSRVLDVVRFGPQEADFSTGRSPDGAPGWQRLATPTPAGTNAGPAVPPIVINEIMYHPASEDDAEQYIEVYNPGTAALPLTGWALQGAVSYVFPTGSMLPAHGYAVVARSAATLKLLYATLTDSNLYGDFTGKLSHNGERIEIAKPIFTVSTNKSGQVSTNIARRVVVDDVTYGTGGRWGRWSDGGGSSLELRDPNSDRRVAPNWGDSDESAKSGWVNIENTGLLDNGNQTPVGLEIILYGAGECLVDNVEVIGPGATNRLANSDFETGTTGWVFQGNHGATSLETNEGYQSKQSLHIRATGAGHTGPNRVRVPLRAALASGQTVTLRAKVRWLKGSPNILLRLHGNWLDAPGRMLAAHNLGTPGASNTQAVANRGPAITEVSHYPILPAASQAVTVTARVSDPDGIGTLVLRWRRDPVATTNEVVMENRGSGLFTATIPGQASSSLVAFHIVASDAAPSPAEARFPADAPTHECLVRWGEALVRGGLGSYRLWATAATISRWSTREKLSNDPLDVTFAYGNSRVIYNAGSQYSGSPYHAPGYTTPTASSCDYLLLVPPDEKFLGEEEMELLQPGNGGGDTTSQQETHAYWIAEQLGLPYCHRRPILMYVNGVKRGITYDDAQQPNSDYVKEWFPNDPNGELRKIQLWFEFDNAGSSFDPVGADLTKYLTTGGVKKPARYRWIWPRRAYGGDPNNFTNLFSLVDAVNTPTSPADNYTRTLQGATDVDEWFRTHVTEHLVGNNDSYSYGGGQNMYAYKPTNGPWRLLIWDIDFAFTAAGPTSDMFGIGGQNVGPINTHPPFARIYWQALIDAVNGPLLAARANAILDSRYNGIRTNGATGVASDTSIKSFVASRRSYLLGLINGKAAPLAFTSNGGTDFTTANNFVTLTGTAPLGARKLTLNGVPIEVTWTTLSNWTYRLPLNSGTNLLVLGGLDPHGTPITNRPASVTAIVSPTPDSPEGHLVINEVMHHPSQVGGGYLELRNLSTTTAYDLSGWRLDGLGFTFPPASYLAAGAYAVIVENTNVFTQLYGGSIQPTGVYGGHFDATGETIRLIRPDPVTGADLVVDAFTYETAPPWPAGALAGAALQLRDPAQDNNRVANWDAVTAGGPLITPEWKREIVTGTASSSALYIYLNDPGEAYIDDLKLVAGTNPDSGPNLLADGDFESGFPGPYVVASNHSGSALSTGVFHSGKASLHMVSTAPGSTRASAITQDITPALTANATYTLSFWYRTRPQGGTLTFRLSGTGIGTSVELNPTQTQAELFTPGRPNSLAVTLPNLPPVWLNELAQQNLNGPKDRFGEHDPWVELYNGGGSPLPLTNCYLASSLTNLTEWAFPAGAQIPAHGFLLTWLDGQPGQSLASEPHASFRAATGEGLLVFSFVAGGRTNLMDYVRYSPVGTDRAVGDYPDGDLSSRHLFALPTPGSANTLSAPSIPVFINEWMADNKSTIADPFDNSYSDWFELYNAGTAPVNLAGFYLSNTLTNRTGFAIPPGYVIPAGGRLLVWADKKTAANLPSDPDLHVDFRLSAAGEAIVLSAADGTVIDAVTFGQQLPDVSEGRVPDGGAIAGALDAPTPGGANIIPAPQVFAISLGNGFATVSWRSLAGVTYLLEATSNLDSPAWTAVGVPQKASSSTLTISEPIPDDSARYYRVNVVQ
jgi:hypothetical protein